MNIIKKSALGLLLGTFTVASLMSLPVKAESNPFEAQGIVSIVAEDNKAQKCGEGKAKKAMKGKCGEGKCGEGKAKKAMKGKCGEGKCGEGKAKKAMKGKCGEGK